jgi:hypothetical protein
MDGASASRHKVHIQGCNKKVNAEEAMTATEERLAALELRLTAAEDELAIIRLVASYGPLVDCGSTQLAPALFTAEGVYDVSYGRMIGHESFSEMLQGEQHQQFVKDGIAHVMGLPWVRVTGDSAIAVNSTQLYLRKDEGYSVFRVAQNEWKLARTPQGWKVTERTNRLIGPDGEAVGLLKQAIDS